MKKTIIETISAILAVVGLVLVTSEAATAGMQVVLFLCGIALLVGVSKILTATGIIDKEGE